MKSSSTLLPAPLQPGRRVHKGARVVVPREHFYDRDLDEDTLRNQVDRWIRSLANLTPNTVKDYRDHLNRFIEFFDGEKEQITPESCLEFGNHLIQSGFKQSYCHRIVRTVKQFFLWRRNTGGIPSPYDNIEGCQFVWSYKHTREKLLTEQQLLKFREANGDCNDSMLSYLLTLAFRTGLRKIDCCLLNWASVDFGRKVICAVPQKTMRYQTEVMIPLIIDPIRPESDIWFALLEKRRMFEELERSGNNKYPYPGNTFVCPEAARMYMSQLGLLNKRFKLAFKKAGLPLSFHSARHGIATVIANSGMNTMTVKRMLGIRSEKTLNTYVRPDEKYFAQTYQAALDANRARDGQLHPAIQSAIAAGIGGSNPAINQAPNDG